MRFQAVLPLPRFVLHPLTAAIVAAVHVYLACGHLSQLTGGEVQWTHLWKGFGALGGAYVFAALASRGLARPEGRDLAYLAQYDGTHLTAARTRVDSPSATT